VKVLTVVGARPQFIKAWPVARALEAAGVHEVLVHTGQHYDDRMSRVFFEEMGIRRPDRNLEVGSGPHGEQTGRMLIALEQVMLEERPDWILVYGDTNTTLAAAIAACKLQLPIAHVEAGLRSFNRSMPEEHNRVLTDHCSTLLFCPTLTAVEHLAREGITSGVRLVGDVMFDAVLHFGALARERSNVLQASGVESGGYYLATIHRPYNTDDPERLAALLSALDRLDAPVVFPIHPRTRARLSASHDATAWRRVRLVEPVGYLDMLQLEQGARGVLTDSGGVQKEAYFFSVPCFTLRPETEWVETVQSGWNTLLSGDPAQIPERVAAWKRPATTPPPVFGDGSAARAIADALATEERESSGR
jgi:UDP-N-acetylglucosamine 2-epimerase